MCRSSIKYPKNGFKSTEGVFTSSDITMSVSALREPNGAGQIPQFFLSQMGTVIVEGLYDTGKM